MRRMNHIPPHFSKVLFSLSAEQKKITDWVWENLEGRFFFGDFYTDKDVQKVAAFELEGEASYFALILDTINVYDNM